MHFHYMIYVATPQHKNPCPEGHEIYNLGGPFLKLVIITMHLVCMNHALKKRRRFLRNPSILHFLPLNHLHFVWGPWVLQSLVSLPYRCYKPNLVTIGSVVIGKKILTNDVRRTTTDANP